MIGWIRDAVKAIDKATRVPLEYLRRRSIRNAAREKLRHNERKSEDNDHDES